MIAALWGDHSLRPSRFSFSSSFSCHSCTVIHSLNSCMPSAGSGGTSSRGTNVADTMCTTCAPFLRNIALSVMFRTTIETRFLPAVSMVYACNTCKPGGRWSCSPTFYLSVSDRHYPYMGIVCRCSCDSSF